MSLSRVHALLQAADRLPAELRVWLVHGLQAFIAGEDLGTALDLPGKTDARRNDLLCKVLAKTPGETVTARCVLFLECLDAGRRHPDPDAQDMIECLRLVDVPRTIRRLRDLVKGKDWQSVSLGSSARHWGYLQPTGQRFK